MEKFKSFFKKHYKKLIVGTAIAAGLGFAGSKFLVPRSTYKEITSTETTILKKKEFVSAISESGKAKSETSRNIYSEKSLPVKEIKVEVGDAVKEGDIIAILEDSTIIQQLEQKQAQITSSQRSAGPQIKNARDRLNEAIRNRDGGTSSQVVSAENAVTSAYDAWQSAERNYENFSKSIALGYNDVLSSQMSSQNSLNSSKDTATLTYYQSQNNLDRLGDDIIRNRDLLNIAKRELEDIKSRDARLDREIADLTKQIEQAKGSISNVDTIAQLELKLRAAESRLTALETEHASKVNSENINDIEDITKIAKEINDLNLEIAKFRDDIAYAKNITPITTSVSSPSIDILTRNLENAQSQSKFIKEKLAEVSANKQKYESEIEAAQKSINNTIDQVNQNKLQVDINQSNIDTANKQKDLSKYSLEDQLKTYRKNADDAKHQYDAAVKNLEIAKIAVNDEINSLRNSLSIASIGADNTLNYVDIKYLNSDLEKTVIKAPIDGTITNVNMIKGQAPTDFVAKIETIDRIIVESQVKEFDINRVEVGMKVEVSSDALPQDTIVTGIVESINPTAIIASGTQTTSNEVAYKVVISLDPNSVEIKPDMNVKVKYIVEKKGNVFAVPTNAIYEKNGKSFMLVIDDKEISTIREIEVVVSSKNDFEAVIDSPELKEKLRVISSPDAFTTGMEVRLVDSPTTDEKPQ